MMKMEIVLDDTNKETRQNQFCELHKLANIIIEETIPCGQKNGEKYVVGLLKDSLYWYVVVYEKTFFEKYYENEEIYESSLNRAIDIRKLPNFVAPKLVDMLRKRLEIVLPMIREAVKKGYIEPDL